VRGGTTRCALRIAAEAVEIGAADLADIAADVGAQKLTDVLWREASAEGEVAYV
jgi:hypothetical protein